MGLEGPAREIKVEPIETPDVMPDPTPVEPVEEPAVPEKEKVEA